MATYTDRRAQAKTEARAATRVGREFSKTPDPHWQHELDRIAPPADTLSGLKILWEPGDHWAPRERWVIWQVYPVDRKGRPVIPWYVPEDALYGPSPRATGHACVAGYCTCAIKANAWVEGPKSSFGIDVWQWQLFQQTGRFHKRWWVVQGPDGGHPYRYDAFEQKYRKMKGESPDAPRIGALPYAEPDLRTWGRIAGLNLLRAHNEMTDFQSRTADHDKRAMRDKDEQFQADKLEWLEDRLHDAAPRFQKALKRAGMAEVKPWEKPAAFDADATRAQLLKEGDYRPLGV